MSSLSALCTGLAIGAETEVIYTEIITHPSSLAPGMLDLGGNPVEARFTALFDIAISHDGTQWIIRADTDLDTTFDQVLLLGSGPCGSPLAQDGQPVPGSTTGELWDFFDTDYPASFNENGDIAFSGRARPSTSIKEKIIKIVGGVPTLFATESTPVTGLVDVPANPTGDELIGNSVGSVSFLNDGRVFFGNTPIQNCSSLRYPALFLDTESFMQSGVSTIDFETWDNFGFGDCGMAPDGLNWYALGDTENPDTTLDRIFAVNNIKIMQENTLLGDTGITAADTFFCRMIANGDWFARGDDTADNDWALKGNADTYTLIAKTGDPITTGAGENWGAVFSAFHGNSVGDWVLAGNTTNADTNLDNVLVLNGTDIVLREGDPVDLNGNGQFDDDVFIGATTLTGSAVTPNDLLITDDGVIYVIVLLRNAANVNLGDAFLRVDLGKAPCTGDLVADGTVNVLDLLALIATWGATGGQADLNGDCTVNIADLLLLIAAWGTCP
ncbi:MAG: dockerin type I domain-containing protein [Phycisphaerales bacterium]|nr:dockerin type I domain-containing protein [Phycisphaerales bacterium]